MYKYFVTREWASTNLLHIIGFNIVFIVFDITALCTRRFPVGILAAFVFRFMFWYDRDLAGIQTLLFRLRTAHDRSEIWPQEILRVLIRRTVVQYCWEHSFHCEFFDFAFACSKCRLVIVLNFQFLSKHILSMSSGSLRFNCHLTCNSCSYSRNNLSKVVEIVCQLDNVIGRSHKSIKRRTRKSRTATESLSCGTDRISFIRLCKPDQFNVHYSFILKCEFLYSLPRTKHI